MSDMQNKGLLTIAIGKKYTRQAKYLACSCVLHAPHILRSVITDNPNLLEHYYDLCIPYNPNFGDPFMTKTRLHLYTHFDKTLYLDADSLVINSIDDYWSALENRSFAYAGKMLTSGTWYLDIASLIRQISVPWLPQFNSGMFLFKKDEKTNAIFDTAYDYLLNQKAKNLNIDFFRKKMLPDEPFLSIALAKHGVKPVEDWGRFSRTLINAENIHLDVIKGIAHYTKDGNTVFPQIVHFCGKFGNIFYAREKIKLNLYFNPPFQALFNCLISFTRKLWKYFSKDDK
jgi:hypothetical protein